MVLFFAIKYLSFWVLVKTIVGIIKEKKIVVTLNNKLWIQLAKKGLKMTDVIAMVGLTTNVMAQMGKDKPITFKNLERICKALDCTPNDVISFNDIEY